MTRSKNGFLFICFLLGFINGISGDCQIQDGCRNEWDVEGSHCSYHLGDEWLTMYQEHKDKACVRSQCCNSSSNPVLLDSFRNGPGCFPSPCVAKTENYCGKISFDNYKYKSIEFPVESTYSEDCKLEDGKFGKIHLCCQKGHIEKMLSVGYAAERNEFPYMVRTSAGCGGTIYNDQWIITAAHCVSSDGVEEKAEDHYVLLGINMETNQKLRHDVEKIVIHKDYSALKENKPKQTSSHVTHDIALLKLKKKIKFGPSVKPIPIAPLDFTPAYHNTDTILAGWGESENFRSASLLRKAYAKYHKDEDCKKWDPNAPDLFYSNYTICLGGLSKRTGESDEEVDNDNDTGGGDSGGPAICKDDDGYGVLCGVVSYGPDISHCQQNYNDATNCVAGTYVRVSNYRPWIIKNAGEQPSESKMFKEKFGEVPVDTEEEAKKYSYLGNIMEGDKLGVCAGTLISKKHVLTAAQCVYTDKGKKKPNLSVQFLVDGIEQKFKVKKIHTKNWQQKFKVANDFAFFRNPNRLGGKQYVDSKYYDYDIAVLELSTPVEGITPVQIATKGIRTSGAATEVSNVPGFEQLIMSTRAVKILPKGDCTKRYDSLNLDLSERGSYENEGVQKFWKWLKDNRKDVKISDRELCYVEKYSGGNKCDRTLGGPLICKNNVLCGIQTFRFCDTAFPMLAVDVSKFSDEIRMLIK